MTTPRKTVLVLGAGINGVAIARELVLNDVPVCLVDCRDIAGGTTAYSSRLIHGGLRYLEYGEFALVRESLEERERLLQLAPHFVRPLHLFIPVTQRVSGFVSATRKFLNLRVSGEHAYVPRGLWLIRMGLFLYDWCARHSSLPRHQVHRLQDPSVPPVDRERFNFLASYYDAQIEFPERFVLAMLEDARRLAMERGGTLDVYTYHRASKQGAQITLTRAADAGPGSGSAPARPAVSFEPAAIVNATGAWVDQTLAQLQLASPPLMGGTKGSHFLTRNAALRSALDGQGIYAEAADGRPVFLLPFGPYSLVGTTDLPCDTDPALVTADAQELEYLVQAVRQVFPQIDLARSDIDMHYCGVRPLPHVSSAETAAITRRHVLHVSDDPDVAVISVVGGKLTTCRSLAEEVARMVLEKLQLPVRHNTRDRAIPGGENYPLSAADVAVTHARLAEQLQWTTSQVAAVWKLCGTRTAQLLAPTTAGETADQRRECLADTDLPLPFVRHVLRDEWCCELEDLVERRLMLLYHPGLSRRCLHHLAELMVDERLLAPENLDQAVTRCAERLKEHFGRTV